MGKNITFRMEKNHTESVFAHEPPSISLLFLSLTSDGDKCKASSMLQQYKELHLYL